MRKFSWFKDSLIQIAFISFAVVFTVFIAQISLSEQYVAYYENKLEAKTETLARNSALLFMDSEINNAAGIGFFLDIIFPSEDEAETIRYALFEPDGRVAATSIHDDLNLPQSAINAAFSEQSIYTYSEEPLVRSFHPLVIEGAVRFILMVQIDDTPFLEFGEQLSESLYSSLFRGCLMMAGGYLLFSAISNFRKKKKTDEDDEDDEESEEDGLEAVLTADKIKRKKEAFARLGIQFASMFFCALLCLLAYWVHVAFDESISAAAYYTGIIFLALTALHLLRIILWLLAWFSRRPISGYAAQTMQFFVFLAVFLSMYVFTIQNGYSTQIEMMTQNELRMSSVFAGLSLSGGDVDESMQEYAEQMKFGEHSELLIIIRSGDAFAVFGNSEINVSEANDLFFSAWEGQASVTGIRGGYKYGVTVFTDSTHELAALAVVRQLVTVQADEMRDTTIDFLLAMSATVFAFVFLFVELNRLLEVINTPNLKRERELRYAKSTRSLMFLVTACRFIPLYFFVLIVRDIYESSPVDWIPGNIATVLPIAVVLLVMAVGKDIAGFFIRLKARKMMIFGCFIGLIGFLLLNYAATLPVLLLLLVFTYTGLSMVFNGLWDFTAETAASGYEEFADMKEQTLSGEYLGATAGAVVGAMVYDKFGLFAAFALSAAILFILAILLRVLLPAGEKAVKAERRELGFFRFFFSPGIFFFMFLLLLPFVLGEYFIEQFSPLYAATIELSPGAASWTSLLMTMVIAYIAPTIVKAFGKLNKTVICVLANMLAAGGLVLFVFMPGLIAMYATSAIIGLSIGIGKNIFAARYLEIKQTNMYAHSGYVYNLFDSLFGLLGAALFTLAHTFFV
ncbi:MAG: MFS transporter [Oscillospiraceae bacterium]|nr:MFS transporter [Oscillospiraceae bacterium]